MSTPPTPENVAEMLTSGDGDYHDGNDWSCSITSKENVVRLKITPADEDGNDLDPVHFRAVVVEGDQTPIVLEQPAELGMSWPDGGDLLVCDGEDIILYPRGVDEWGMSPAQAREMAAQLAAMADACEAANGGDAR